MRAWLAVLVAILALGAPAAALAQDCPRTSLADVEDEVMCPVCGTPLGLATEAPQAQRQREYIESLVDDCRSKDEIKEALVAQFGPAVLALPGDGGDDDLGDVLVYVIPAVALVLAGCALTWAALRWRRRPRGGAPVAEDLAPAVDARLDADIERYEL